MLSQQDVVLFSGDSITDGNRGRSMDCNHIMGHGYAEMISGRLGMDNWERRPKFVNKGYSGAGISRLYETWNQDVLQNKPTILSILVGINDVFAGENMSGDINAQRYEENYRRLLQDTIETLPGIKIVLCEPFYIPARNHQMPYENAPHLLCEPYFTPLNAVETPELIAYRQSEVRKLQRIVSHLAREFQCVFVPFQNMFERLIKESETEYFLWDGFHPTIVGHSFMAQQWLEYVQKAVEVL